MNFQVIVDQQIDYRVIGLVRHFREIFRYISPPHLVLTNLELSPNDVIATSICRLVGNIPREMPKHTPAMTPAIKESLKQAEASPISDQLIIFMGMAGLMTLVKEIKLTSPNANYEYFRKRWHALCAKARIPDMIKQGKLSTSRYIKIMEMLVQWQTSIKTEATLRRKFVDYALESTDENVIVKGALAQIKMVFQDF